MNRRIRSQAPYFTEARFPSTCPETGLPIRKGDRIAYYPATRQAFHDSSKSADSLRAMEFAQAFNMGDADY